MTCSGLFLHPNFGAEEGRPAPRSIRALRNLPALWGALFASPVRLLDADPGRPWESLAPPADEPAFRELRGLRGLLPWYSDPATGRLAADRGLPLAAPEAGAVARVHDKAFCLRFAQQRPEPPDPVSRSAAVLDPEEAADRERLAAGIERIVSRWPAFRAGAIVVKPRLGTSGRGCYRGSGLDPAALRRIDPAGFSARGGAVVEPWADRRIDLSTQLWISRTGEVSILGTTRQLLSEGGTYRGNEGRIGPGGEIESGSPHDAAIRSAATALARRAAERGFWGACGVDSFVYRDPERGEILRPLVELNARFTTGTVAVGLVRRWSASNPTRRARWWRFLLLDPAGPDPVPGADVEWEHRLALDPFGEAAVSLLLLGPPTR